jgi:hypothetical protein
VARRLRVNDFLSNSVNFFRSAPPFRASRSGRGYLPIRRLAVNSFFHSPSTFSAPARPVRAARQREGLSTDSPPRRQQLSSSRQPFPVPEHLRERDGLSSPPRMPRQRLFQVARAISLQCCSGLKSAPLPQRDCRIRKRYSCFRFAFNNDTPYRIRKLTRRGGA